ncbi:hypothetical protein [Parasphingorhabdus sp.]|jgi:hypothetical protein|uniref:hypothetical protein n=1 Tax=Parasphingorhabdus sp. TaxID=2709688 RepID=UPI000AD786B2
MLKIFKSDLTYSLSAGFFAGALVLFLIQPADSRSDSEQNLSSSVSSAAQLLS